MDKKIYQIIGVYTYNKEPEAYLVMDLETGAKSKVELDLAIRLAKAGQIKNAIATTSAEGKGYLRGNGCSLDDLPKKEEPKRYDNTLIRNYSKDTSKYVVIGSVAVLNKRGIAGYAIMSIEDGSIRIVNSETITKLINSGNICNTNTNSYGTLPNYIYEGNKKISLNNIMYMLSENQKLHSINSNLTKAIEQAKCNTPKQEAIKTEPSMSDEIIYNRIIPVIYGLKGISTEITNENNRQFKLNPDASEVFYCYGDSIDKLLEINKDCKKVRATRISMLGEVESSKIYHRYMFRVSDIRMTISDDIYYGSLLNIKNTLDKSGRILPISITGTLYDIIDKEFSGGKNSKQAVIIANSKEQFTIGIGVVMNSNKTDYKFVVKAKYGDKPIDLGNSELIDAKSISANNPQEMFANLVDIAFKSAGSRALNFVEFDSKASNDKLRNSLAHTLATYYGVTADDIISLI